MENKWTSGSSTMHQLESARLRSRLKARVTKGSPLIYDVSQHVHETWRIISLSSLQKKLQISAVGMIDVICKQAQNSKQAHTTKPHYR